MTEPRWLTLTVALAVHADQIREHGGTPGLRDRGLLESALARAPNLHRYQPQADLCALASAYGFGIARDHPFVDGNKRVAFQAMYVFLGLNGLTIESEEPEVVHMMVALAGGEMSDADVALWLRGHTVPR